jgi:hypothetical protein
MHYARFKSESELLASGWVRREDGVFAHIGESLLLLRGMQTHFGAWVRFSHIGDDSVRISEDSFVYPRTAFAELTGAPLCVGDAVSIMTQSQLIGFGWRLHGDDRLYSPTESGIHDFIFAEDLGRTPFVSFVSESGTIRFSGSQGVVYPLAVSLPAAEAFRRLDAPAPTEDVPAPAPESTESGEPFSARRDRFRSAPRIVARGLVTAGFELETQASEGKTKEDIEPQFNEEAFDDYVSERASEKMGDLSNILPSREYDRLCERVQELIAEDTDRGEFYDSDDDPSNLFDYIPKVEVVLDGSVDGFEFRTHGGLSYPEFRRAADAVFDMEHKIDSGCSFHIHLRVRDIKHTHSAGFQRLLVEYLSEVAYARVPESVRERWAGIRQNQYIRGIVARDGEKYAFVRKHPIGTWEFRCFGNVQNAADAMACLDLAIEAMQYAYAGVSRFGDLSDEEFTDCIKTALSARMTPSQYARSQRKRASGDSATVGPAADSIPF